MALNFPQTPEQGDIYEAENGVTYVFDGIKWLGRANQLGGGNNNGRSTDRITSGNASLVIGVGNSNNPYVVFPNFDGSQLAVQGNEIAAIQGGNVTVSGSNEVVISSHLSAAPRLDWTFSYDGSLTVPHLFPKSFTAVLDDLHMVNAVGFAGMTPFWEFNVQFQVDPNGNIVTMLDNPFPILGNPGYVSGYTFRYTEADHGIPGYTFDIELTDVVNPGPAGWTANPAVTQAPAYPSSVKSAGAIKVTSNDNSWVFGTDGKLTLPLGGDIVDGAGQSVIGGNGSITAFSVNNSNYWLNVTQLQFGDNLTVSDVGDEGSGILRIDASSSGSGVSISDFGDGFSLTGTNKIVTNKLYSTNQTNSNQHYRLTLDTNGVVVLPDQSIINGATLRVVPGTGELNYAALAAGPDADHPENTWMWVDYTGGYIGTDFSGSNYTWHFDNNGKLNLPTTGSISYVQSPGSIILNANGNPWSFDSNGNLSLPEGGDIKNSTGSSVLGGGSPVTVEQRYFDYTGDLDLFGTDTLTAVTGLGADDAEWEISLPFDVTFLGQTYNSIWLSSNSYIAFQSVAENSPGGYPVYWPLGPKNLAVPVISVGAGDRAISRYYYGSTDDGRFVIRYEGSVGNWIQNTDANSVRIWELWFYENEPGKISLVVDDNTPTGGVWGIHDGTKWVDIYNELPFQDPDTDWDMINSVDIYYKEPQTVNKFKFVGQGVETYFENQETYVAINPLQGILNATVDSNGNTLLTSPGYGLILKSSGGDAVSIESSGGVAISAKTPDATSPGNGNSISLYAGNGFGTNTNGGDILLATGGKTGTGTSGKLYVNAAGKEWTFNPDGKLRLPQGGDIINYFGASVLGGAASTGDITFDGIKIQGAGGPGAMELVPDSTLYGQGQYVRIYPTNAYDYPHVHIAPGQNGELYIGDDYQYFKTHNTGSLSARSNNGDIGLTTSAAKMLMTDSATIVDVTRGTETFVTLSGVTLVDSGTILFSNIDTMTELNGIVLYYDKVDDTTCILYVDSARHQPLDSNYYSAFNIPAVTTSMTVVQRAENSGSNSIHTLTEGAEVIPVGTTATYNGTTFTITGVLNPDPYSEGGVTLTVEPTDMSFQGGDEITFTWEVQPAVQGSGTATVWVGFDAEYSWTFDNKGLLTLPGNFTVGTLWPEDSVPGGDKESVVWAQSDTEYLGLWWGGDKTYPTSGYGPNAGIMIGGDRGLATDDFTNNILEPGTGITIAVNDDNGDTVAWTFDNTGKFTLSKDSTIEDLLDNGDTPGGIVLTVNGNQTKFDTGGRTHFPNDIVINYGGVKFTDNTVQTTAYLKVNPPGTSKGQPGDKMGMVAYDSDYFYYCIMDYQSTDILLTVNTTSRPLAPTWFDDGDGGQVPATVIPFHGSLPGAEVGQYFIFNGQLYTIYSISDTADNYSYISVTPQMDQPTMDQITTGTLLSIVTGIPPTVDVWVRSAWTNTTW